MRCVLNRCATTAEPSYCQYVVSDKMIDHRSPLALLCLLATGSGPLKLVVVEWVVLVRVARQTCSKEQTLLAKLLGYQTFQIMDTILLCGQISPFL